MSNSYQLPQSLLGCAIRISIDSPLSYTYRVYSANRRGCSCSGRSILGATSAIDCCGNQSRMCYSLTSGSLARFASLQPVLFIAQLNRLSEMALTILWQLLEITGWASLYFWSRLEKFCAQARN